MKSNFVIMALLLTNAGCASERLYVKVVDDEGNPVTNGVVHVGFSTSHVLFGGGNSRRSKSEHAEGRTDKNGDAVVKFNCQSSDFGWHVEADGYYRGEFHREHFKGEDVIVPPTLGFVKLHEHEKRRAAVLYRKKNPQPMYAYSRQKQVESPIANGRYGFDLQCFDWLPPFGKGKVADLYYVRERKDIERINRLISQNNEYRIRVFRSDEPDAPQFGDIVGRIEFEKGCGAYVCKQTGNENFPATHHADSNANYSPSLPIKICENNGKLWLMEGPVVAQDEYMVIRSRVKYDEKGNIISANYSKIIGPGGFAGCANFMELVFNPRPNDTNLEFDPERNLYQGRVGRGSIP
ncbi:MAG: hypothetical protein IJG84_03315 [Kiritimatiellae bacterium]|nr:hypothetical protein [Kiritimatiellia bacterium]